jgi:hypothetical protein
MSASQLEARKSRRDGVGGGQRARGEANKHPLKSPEIMQLDDFLRHYSQRERKKKKKKKRRERIFDVAKHMSVQHPASTRTKGDGRVSVL